jgi:DNA-binding CsgD family transcriptional regulator
MQRHFEHIEALGDIGDVLRYAGTIGAENGAIRLTYHAFPSFGPRSARRTVAYAQGYDSEWLDLYERAEFRAVDPIPERTLAHGGLLSWREARTIEPNSDEEEAFFVAMHEHRLIHGFGIPLFGSRGRDAYASFDYGVAMRHVPAVALGVIRGVFQSAHQRICVLLDTTESQPDLSERELEVLRWMVKGKSYPVIAEILALSPDTVKTYSKRVYAKLDTFDRVGAVVKALQLGLITL